MTKPSSRCFDTCKPITGTQEVHCVSCHLTFAFMEDFDHHRYDPNVPEDEDNTCWEPASIGFICVDNVWGSPDSQTKRENFIKKMQTAREARGHND